MKQPLVLVPGLFATAGFYRSWVTGLESLPYNLRVYLAEISQAAWAGTLVERFEGALQAVSEATQKALAETGAAKIKLVGHSAGGRVARLWLSELSYRNTPAGGQSLTDTLIMLGAANQTHESWSKKSVAWANQHIPGAFYSHINYVTVIGRAVEGRPGLSPLENLAAVNYRVQNGGPTHWGDGVIPVACAALPGATNLVLNGIYHGSVAGRPGYESPAALGQWASHLG